MLEIAWRECESLGRKSSNFSKGSGGLEHVTTSESTNSRIHGARRSIHVDPAEESDLEEDDEDHIEEIFGQLWAIPKPAKPRVPPSVNDGYLAWARHELLEADRVRPEDCFPVS
jgi:hypothetical protein